jgi:hypothetical protein
MATFGPDNKPPDLWSDLDAVGAAMWQAGGTTGVILRHASAGLAERVCVYTLGMGIDESVEFIGNSAYIIVLLITFPIALLQGAGYIAILQLGIAFLFTEIITPYIPTAFAYAAANPTTSLVIITLVCMAVAKHAGQKVTLWDLRVPQADNPVLWEAVVLLFIVRSCLPWVAANIVLMIGVFITRWGYMFACVWPRRARVHATQT